VKRTDPYTAHFITCLHCDNRLNEKNCPRSGSRWDRPCYCVTTPVRAGHWPLNLTYDLELQS